MKNQILAAVVVAFLGLTIIISTAEACVCQPLHSQQHYCQSEYVIVARILSRRLVQKGRSMYKIEIRKSYKMSDAAKEYLRHGRIFSSDHDSMCGGIDFKLGELYLLAASSVNVGICNFIQPYSQMTIVEKRGFAGGYKKGCDCKIDTCYDPEDCPRTSGGCTWFGPWIESCESNFGVCVPSRGFKDEQGRPTKCHWRRNTPYSQCLHDP